MPEPNTELKECPFCGCPNVRSHINQAGFLSLRCIGCDCRGPIADTKEEAREAWNQRVGEGS